MAGFVSLGDNKYIGTFVAGEDLQNGQFVNVDYETGEATLGGDYFVQNIITNIPEDSIGDADFVIKKGKHVRLYKAKAGHILVTTIFDGGLEKGDKVVATNGEVEKAGEESDAQFVVKEKTTAFGKDAVSLLAL